MSLTTNQIIRHSRLSEFSNLIQHGFFTRLGGVSKGIYQGLNIGLGSDDNQEDVIKNRELVAEFMGVDDHDQLLSPIQVHSPDVWVVNEHDRLDDRIRADAVATNTPGVPIAIATADCGPVLFLDPENTVIGAAHAGWKGATGGVLENTIEAMEGLGASRGSIIAILGPSISQKNYEVDAAYRANIMAMDEANTQWFIPSQNEGRYMFDLQGYTVNRLEQAGVEAAMTGHCTYADEERFFSYRRTTHRQEPDYGRQISAISISKS